MGHISQIRFKYEDSNRLDQIIRACPFFDLFNADYKLYEFRGSQVKQDTPDCAIRIEPYGLEFNALGDCEVYRQVNANLTVALEKMVGKVEEVS